MTGYLFLGTVLLAIMFLLLRAFMVASPGTLARTVRYGGIGLGVVALAFLALTGRLGAALMLGATAAPLLIRWRSRRAFAGGSPRAAASGRTSEVETLYLRMVLDHDSGAMTGQVLHGPLRGRPLHSLTPRERRSLLDDCRREDAQSASVLEAWLDRADPGWRTHEEEPVSGGSADGTVKGSGAMTREEACEILGVTPGATAEEVKESHRRLMMKVHPDHGGSTYLAAKINQAKDLLLRT
jgi:hypothetical protein